MHPRDLVIAMVALVALRLAIDGSAPAERALEGVAAATTAFAAFSFVAGDPPRLPWLLRAGALTLVLVAHLVDPLQGPAEGAPRLAHGILIAANIGGAAAMFAFFRVIRASELVGAPANARRLLAGLIVAAAAALGFVAVGLAPDLQPVSSPYHLLRAITLAVSAAADALVFVIAVRIVQALLPMRDGAAARPYLLLAIDGLSFLAIDVVHASRGLDPAIGGPLVAVMGAVGGAAGIAAAIAQARLLRPGRPLA